MQEARGGGGDFQQIFAKIRDLTAQRDKQAEEVLTKEQQDKFAKLKGKAFDLSALRPAFGGRRNQNN